jgi:predicted  nucleic acid-binding Zn-ribbon protein
MEILKRIADLKKSILETNQLVDDLISSLEAQQNRISNKEKKILQLKEEVKINVAKIDEIIKAYNANS